MGQFKLIETVIESNLNVINIKLQTPDTKRVFKLQAVKGINKQSGKKTWFSTITEGDKEHLHINYITNKQMLITQARQAILKYLL